MAQQEHLDPINDGKMLDDEEKCLTVKWMKYKPAPNEVLFNHMQTSNITLSFIFKLPLIFFTLFFIIDIGIDGM